jgi:uncharacterized surface protein with fasciclin (FAS1) repeats
MDSRRTLRRTGASAVLCGNIPTANATVYVIDTVLTRHRAKSTPC